MRATERILHALREANPGLTVKEPGHGGGHYKLFMNGRLVGIIPNTLAKEGLSKNLVSQLRRGGVRI